MIRRLRIKFVCINMVLVTAMLWAILAVVLHSTQAGMASESMRAMEAAVLPGPQRPAGPGWGPRCFTLELGPGGELSASPGADSFGGEAWLRQVWEAARGQQEGLLEEEGLPYTPPDQRPVTPPAYPDASRLGGGGGGARAYQVPKQSGWRKTLHISLWAVALVIAIIAAIGSVNRWSWNHYGGNYATESIPVPDWDAGEEAIVEDMGYYQNAPYDEGFMYTEGETWFDANDVKTIDIQWSAGLVFIQSWNESNLMVQEYAENELSDRTRMETSLEDGVLTVRYRSSVGVGNVKGQKWLTVLVPEGLMGELDVATTSAAVRMTGLEADTLRASSVSGDITVTDCYAQTSDFSSTSGMLILQTLESNQVEVSTTSGDIYGDLWFDSADKHPLDDLKNDEITKKREK